MSQLEIATDLLTPLGAYLRLRERSTGTFLLESVEHAERWSRFSCRACAASSICTRSSRR